MKKYHKSIDKKVKARKKGIIFLIMILVSVVSFIIIFKTDIFKIKKIEVYGNTTISKEEIVAESGIILGNHILKESIKDIESNLYNNPYVKTADVKRKLPDRMVIQIVEREEEAAIPFMNEFLIIDEDGMVLRSSTSNGNLKIIKGLEFTNFIEGAILTVKDKSQLSKALEIVRGINKNQILIKELDVTNKKDIIIKFTDNLSCKIGEGNNLDYRLKVLKKILEDLNQKKIIRGVIDISHEGYPSYRPVE
ncbi:cell division protein FtsQ/DivIB [Crassaminicella indica]|uniref:FtsQ-type POTRA domain-containing protein n=1 Tax=Crassaminicella indica TaxID=2855394 RepID=A0ABX8RAI8_9CLOT|nr:FtsQ-type POTRA domain-containing protein [Crassaminicella indica]QXM05821.1 FtsQ-type POTRA domain-containing protein [Crassaminicella indica]